MRRKRQLLFGAVLMMLLACCGCRDQGEDASLQELTAAEEPEGSPEDGAAEEETEEEETEKEKGKLYVYVCGQVNRPGVYELEEGDRVFQALEAAGGLTDEAAAFWLNQAELLADGAQIYVPDAEEAEALRKAGESPQAGTEAAGGEDGKVNLNTAGREELMTLNGIGETKADSILRYREEHGSFQSIEEIQQVEGIKEGTYQKIKDQITVQ